MKLLEGFSLVKVMLDFLPLRQQGASAPCGEVTLPLLLSQGAEAPCCRQNLGELTPPQKNCCRQGRVRSQLTCYPALTTVILHEAKRSCRNQKGNRSCDSAQDDEEGKALARMTKKGSSQTIILLKILLTPPHRNCKLLKFLAIVFNIY